MIMEIKLYFFLQMKSRVKSTHTSCSGPLQMSSEPLIFPIFQIINPLNKVTNLSNPKQRELIIQRSHLHLFYPDYIDASVSTNVSTSCELICEEVSSPYMEFQCFPLLFTDVKMSMAVPSYHATTATIVGYICPQQSDEANPTPHDEGELCPASDFDLKALYFNCDHNYSISPFYEVNPLLEFDSQANIFEDLEIDNYL